MSIDDALGDRVFNWRPPTDEAREGNRPFLLSAKVPGINTNRPVRSRRWKRFEYLDQGSVGACTGFGAAHCLSAGNRRRRMTNALALGFYAGAQRYDEWPGEDYEGSSVLGVMRYLHHETPYLREYWWATTLEELVYAVAFYDLVEMGSWWKSRMMNTDSEGFIHYAGGNVGGHAYAIGAVRVEPGRPIQDGWAEVWNSWGHEWGVNGSARIRLGDLGQALADQGECALPRKARPA